MTLRTEVIEGLKALYLLNLPNTPAADKMGEVGEIWLAIIESRLPRYSERDKGRIHAGFLKLMSEIERWPAPKQLLEMIPDPKPIPEEKRISRPSTPEEKAEIRAFMDDLVKKLKMRI